MKKTLRRAAAAFISSTMLFTMSAALPSQTAFAASCTIDTGKTYQTIRGFGGINLPEWQAINLPAGTTADMSAAQVQKAFGNGNDELGLTILRIYISDDSSQWKTAVPTALAAQELGATVFASPWYPPASMRSNGNGSKYHLNNNQYGDYAKHLNSYIKYMEGQGVNLYSVSVQNEPDYAQDWTGWSTNELVTFLADYGNQVTAGTNAKMMSPESFQYRKETYNAILNNQKAFANTDLFGTHFYGTSRNDMNFPALENCGKDIWMTEVYVPDSNSDANTYPQALQVSENIHNGLVVGNMNAYVWWFIRRKYSPMKDDGTISKRGYCMAQYSKWVRPGAVRIDATESPENNVLVSAYKNTDGSIAIVAINKSSGNLSENFTVKGANITSVKGYRTSSNENIKDIGSVSASGSGFSAQLPGNSVTTFVIAGSGSSSTDPGTTDPGTTDPPVTTTPPVTVTDPDGYIAHYTFENGDEDFTGRGGASVKTASEAYAGSKSLLCSGRTDSWNGAAHALPSGCSAGETYSFSAVVKYTSGSASDTFHFTLQYNDGSSTSYKKIATETVTKGDWVQLANPSFTIPAGATDCSIYIETDSSTNDFYVDEMIVAKSGTAVSGPKPVKYAVADVNGDGFTNAVDLTLAKRGIIKGSFAAAGAKKGADVTQEGEVTKDDITWFVKYLTKQETEIPPAPEKPAGQMRPIAEYTPECEKYLVNNEPASSHQERAGVQYGTIQKKTYFSKKANKNKPYNIMLPAGYSTDKKYPVLYVLHGFFENENRMITQGNGQMYTKQIVGNAIADGEAVDMIVVVPFVFTHPTMNDATGFADQGSNEGYDNFVDDIVDSLMPHIEENYSVATGRENTAVTGFSMGGRESLQIGMKYGDKFGYVGAICPAPGASGAWKWSKEEDTPSLVMITGGTQDDVVGLNTPEGYHNNFNRNSVPHLWHIVQNGHHGDDSIHSHLYAFVRMVFKA